MKRLGTKFKITFFLGILIPAFTSAQFKKSKTITIDTLASGCIEKTELYIKESKVYNLHDYEKHTRKIVTRYYKTGKIHYRQIIQMDQGSDQPPCKESYFKQEFFWENGKKKSLLEFECDCHKYWEKEWNKDGQLLFKLKSKIKRLY